jgi:hypothetical protein
MRKFVFSILFLFIFSLVYSAPAPWMLGVNEKTNQCGEYWAGDEFVNYDLPKDWNAYWIDLNGFDRVINSKYGNCSIGVGETTGFDLNEAKYCCNKFGFNFIYWEYPDRWVLYKNRDKLEELANFFLDNNMTYADMWDGSTELTERDRQISAYVFDFYPILNEIYEFNPNYLENFKYKNRLELYANFSKSIKNLENYNDFTDMHFNSDLNQCTVSFSGEAGYSTYGDNYPELLELVGPLEVLMIRGDGWSNNSVRQMVVDYNAKAIVKTPIGTCNFNHNGYEDCCNQLGMTFVPGNIGVKVKEDEPTTMVDYNELVGINLAVVIAGLIILVIIILILWYFLKKRKHRKQVSSTK